MTRLAWDAVGTRKYETGVDQGVLYIPTNGSYDRGVAWNGLTTVTEAPAGAEASAKYADNIKYLNLISAETFGATVEALTYPPEFEQFDGTALVNGGISVHQQDRHPFGLCYRSRVGTDVDSGAGYKYHLVYGAQAQPSQKAFATVNDTPDAIQFSWQLSTSPVSVTGFKPTALLVVDSTNVPSGNLAQLQNQLYGTDSTAPRLPLPDEVIGMFAGTLIAVQPQFPTYDAPTKKVTIPTQTGVVYQINGVAAPASYTIPSGMVAVVKARPAAGYTFSYPVQETWVFPQQGTA